MFTLTEIVNFESCEISNFRIFNWNFVPLMSSRLNTKTVIKGYSLLQLFCCHGYCLCSLMTRFLSMRGEKKYQLCWFAWKGSLESCCCWWILAGNSLTMSRAAVLRTMDSTLTSLVKPTQLLPHFSSDRRKLMSVRLWVKPNGAQ